MDIFNKVFADFCSGVYVIKTLEDLREQCFQHKINIFAKSFTIRETENPEFWILCHKDETCLTVFTKTGRIINYIEKTLDLHFNAFLFSADRQGTRQIHRNNPQLFKDKISPAAVERLLEKAIKKLQYVHILKFNNLKRKT